MASNGNIASLIDEFIKAKDELGKVNKNLDKFSEKLEDLDDSGDKLDDSFESIERSAKKTGTGFESLNVKTQAVVRAIDAMIEAAKLYVNYVKTANAEIAGKAGIAQHMNTLRFNYENFNAEMKIMKQQFELQKENRLLSAERAKIEKEKGDISIIEQAHIRIAQAELGLKQARLGLAQAGIALAKSEWDYRERLLQIEGNLINTRKAAAEAQKNYIKELEGLYEPWVKLDHAAATYTKTIGGSKESMGMLKKETLDFANTQHLQAKYNISAQELLELQQKYNAELGRSVKLTDSEKESFAALRQVYGDDKAVEFATKLATFGYDITRASGVAGRLFANASKHGIAMDKLSKNLLSNMKLAQTLSFANGVKGLQAMAEKATEMNFNMQETAKAADKLSTLEGAMEAAAQLSVLGGNFALFSNPLALMNGAMNDAEGLQDMIINQFSNLAYWDAAKGEITMNGIDRLKLKEAAKAMGMDPTALSDLAFEKARKDKLSPEIDKLGVDDDIKRLLRNVAQLDENGNGFVNIGGNRTSLEEAAKMNPEELADILRTQNNSDSDNIKEIAESVLSIKDNIDAWGKALADNLVVSIETNNKNLADRIKQEATDSENLRRMADVLANVYGESAEFNKKNAEFQKEKAEGTADYERQSAALQKQQTAYAYESAKLGERSAALNQKLTEYALREANIQLSQLDISRRQSDVDVAKLTLDEGRFLIELKNREIAMNTYYTQVASLKLQQAQFEYNTGKAAGGLLGAIAGGIAGAGAGFLGGGPIGAILGASAGMKLGSELIGGAAGIWRGTGSFMDYLDFSSKGRGNWDYIDKSLESSFGGYATGGMVNRGRRFDTGGVANIGGMIIGPTHADGGVMINAQGGEYIMPVDQAKMYYSELESMRHKTFPVGDGGFGGMAVAGVGSAVYTGGGAYNYGGHGPQNVKLDVSGTITLDLSGNTANIDVETLLKEPYLSQIVSAISKSQNNYNGGGNRTETNLFDPSISW